MESIGSKIRNVYNNMCEVTMHPYLLSSSIRKPIKNINIRMEYDKLSN